MTNPAKLAAQLRYHLSEMGASNAFHDFEHMARHVARARVYSNILVATGPVSSGGDQSADFETFRTYLVPASTGSEFAERASGTRRVVFACSIEKKIEGKIRSDIAEIVGYGNVDEVVYFCEANVPVAKRNKLKAKAGIALQIFDGNAIAEFLAEPDLFWIAQEFLRVPAEIAPAVVRDDEYGALLNEWKAREALPISHADFVAIKSGLRQATRNPQLRPDLGLWLDRMARFLENDAPRDLHKVACYETAVAHLRGRGDMTGQLALIENFFSDVDAFPAQGDLTDAVVLLQYCLGAIAGGALDVPIERFGTWRDAVETVLDAERALAAGPGRMAGLLHLTGIMTMLPGPDGANLDGAIVHWNAMLDRAEQAPLYPLEHFADYLTEIMRHFGDVPELSDLAARNDALLADRLGALAAGEKAIGRAFSLIEGGNDLAVIRELQRAKANWMSGERLAGALAILVLLSRLYLDLGLAYAAKYHAGLAAYMSRYETDDTVQGDHARALASVLDAENAAGNGFGFIQLLNVHVAAHLRFDAAPLDPERHPAVHENIGQMAALLGLLHRQDPAARAAVDDIRRYWPAELGDPIWAGADDADGFWTKGDWAGLWADLEENMVDRPFGDLGAVRTVSWRACGIHWEVEFDNTYRATAASEQLMAELQTIACAAAGRDLGIVPSRVRIGITVSPEHTAMTVAEGPDGYDFLVGLPETDRGFDGLNEVLALFGSAVSLCSVTDIEDLFTAFDAPMLSAAFIGRPYAEIYRELMPEDGFRADIRAACGPFGRDRPFSSRAGDRVPWYDGTLPVFDIERARGDAQNRYEKTIPSIRHSLAAAAADPDARARLLALHERGMTDWEIVSILGNIAANHRSPISDGDDMEEVRQRYMALMTTPEKPDEALDPAVFSERALVDAEGVYHGAFMASWGLHLPPNRDADGLETFLVRRMKLREVDAPHERLFDWSGAK